MPVIARVERLVSDSLRRCGYSGRDLVLVVGVSGGPDSTALLRCLERLRDQHRLRLHVAHLNHDFRGAEADADADFVAALARRLGLAVTVEKEDPVEYQRARHISSFEQGARELRYQFLARVAHRVGATAVAVAHTSDDQAETVLLHLLRGAGLHGLQGMTEVAPWPWPREVADLRLYRPLLEAAREETAEYCRELGQEFRQDTGNQLWRFTRNRVRLDLLPGLAAEYNPRVREALARLARTTALEVDYLEQQLDQVWPRVTDAVAGASEGSLRFRRAELARLHPLLQRLALRRGYATLLGDARRLAESHLRAMTELLAGGGSGGQLDLPGGLRLSLTYAQLVLAPRDQEPEPSLPPLAGPYSLPLPNGPGQERVIDLGDWRVTCRRLISLPAEEVHNPDEFTAYLDRRALPDTLAVRTWQPGDRFQPLGMDRTKKLQDFFSDARVPRNLRHRVPLLTADRGIVWVVGYRIAEWARANPEGGGDAPVLMVRFEIVEEENSPE